MEFIFTPIDDITVIVNLHTEPKTHKLLKGQTYKSFDFEIKSGICGEEIVTFKLDNQEYTTLKSLFKI